MSSNELKSLWALWLPPRTIPFDALEVGPHLCLSFAPLVQRFREVEEARAYGDGPLLQGLLLNTTKLLPDLVAARDEGVDIMLTYLGIHLVLDCSRLPQLV